MKKSLKMGLLILLNIILIILFAPLLGKLFSIITGERGGSWIGDESSWNFIFGLFMGYSFFVSLFLTIFGGKNKYWMIVILIGLELFFLGAWLTMVIIVLSAIIGWFLAQIILLISRQFKKS